MRKISFLLCFCVLLLGLVGCSEMPARKPVEVVIQKTNGYETTIDETKIVERVMMIVENVNWKEGTNPSMSRKEDARFQVNYENKEKETYLVWFGKYGNAEFIRVSAKGSTYGTLVNCSPPTVTLRGGSLYLSSSASVF